MSEEKNTETTRSVEETAALQEEALLKKKLEQKAIPAGQAEGGSVTVHIPLE